MHVPIDGSFECTPTYVYVKAMKHIFGFKFETMIQRC